MSRSRQIAEPASQSGGGRVELRLEAQTPTSGHYSARWLSAGQTFVGSARVDETGVELEGAEAPPWLLDFTAALLRLIERDHADGAPWPRRLTRWRKSPDEG
jgi:hypothetical protein